jgi:hypothetical protein
MSRRHRPSYRSVTSAGSDRQRAQLRGTRRPPFSCRSSRRSEQRELHREHDRLPHHAPKFASWMQGSPWHGLGPQRAARARRHDMPCDPPRLVCRRPQGQRPPLSAACSRSCRCVEGSRLPCLRGCRHPGTCRPLCSNALDGMVLSRATPLGSAAAGASSRAECERFSTGFPRSGRNAFAAA